MTMKLQITFKKNTGFLVNLNETNKRDRIYKKKTAKVINMKGGKAITAITTGNNKARIKRRGI